MAKGGGVTPIEHKEKYVKYLDKQYNNNRIEYYVILIQQ
jgi:hypothetical protein